MALDFSILRHLRPVPGDRLGSTGQALGLAAGLAGLASGGGVQRHGRVVEFWGGAVTGLLRRAPLIRGALAMTLGHVVLGQSTRELDRCRAHELVHVRQYGAGGRCSCRPTWAARSSFGFAAGIITSTIHSRSKPIRQAP